MSTALVPDPILCFGPSISITTCSPSLLTRKASNDHPIVLCLPAHATVDDFRAFIFFLIPSLMSDITWDVTTWTGVLRIGNWAMLDSARDAAIRHLDHAVKAWPPTQLFRFAQEHRVIEWHIHAVKELLCRPENLTAREVDKLESEMAVRIMNVRLRAERVATVRVFNRMAVNVRNHMQELYTGGVAIVTIDQMHRVLDDVQGLMLQYRAALPGVVTSSGGRWATVIYDTFVMSYFPVDFV